MGHADAYMRQWTKHALIGSDNDFSPVQCQAIIRTNPIFIRNMGISIKFQNTTISIQESRI